MTDPDPQKAALLKAKRQAHKDAQRAAKAAAAEQAKQTAARQDALRANYAYAATVLAGSGQADLFDRAVREAWTPDRFQAALMNTDWYRNRSEAQRQAQIQQASEPAQWQATIDAHVAKLREQALAVGATFSEAELAQLANESVLGGWDDGAVSRAMAGHVTASAGGSMFGAAGQLEDELRQAASANGMQYTDDWYRAAARSVTAQSSGKDLWLDSIREDAAGQFPVWAEQIRQGQNVRDMATPWIRAMAQTLEIPEGQVSLSDPTLRKGILGVTDTGQQAVSPIWQFENSLRSDSRWERTQNAQMEVASAADAVLRGWGFVK